MAGRNEIKDPVLAATASEHIEIMKSMYMNEMELSAINSVVYGGPDKKPERHSGRRCKQVFRNIDTVSAAIEFSEEGKIALLNFADYTRRGGIFLRGSHAQEEGLCMESTLFGILNDDALTGYYEYNKKNRNRELYTDRAIYTPKVIFVRDDKEYRFDVISCAAPNKGAAGRYHNVKTDENHRVMQQRIKFMRDVAEDQKVDVLIAGAWGCGVFGQPPTLVAKWFDETFSDSGIGTVVYAVPPAYKKKANENAFRKMFGV